MRRAWVIVTIIVVGVVLGIAIAGVPSRHQDPPLRISAAPSGPTTTASSSPPTTVAPTTITTPPHPKGDVGVVVVNAAGLPGKGSDFTARLRQAGYSAFAPQTDNNDHPATSVVEFIPGYQGDAVAIGALVGIGPVAGLSDNPISSKNIGSANVMVVIGGDLH
ncbi:MAG: hypothetical protein NVS3B21_28170 [Acidimicrobiales bacterium]